MNKKSSTHTRVKILEVAAQIASQQGATRITLDAVSAEAGISKGGLLYHFASKEALVEGLVSYCIEQFDERMRRALAAVPIPSGRDWLRAYITTVFDTPPDEAKLTTGLMAAVAINPALLGPMQRRYQDWQQQIEASGIDPTVATMIRLTLDGLWVNDLLQLGQLEATQRATLQAYLLAQVEA